MLNKKMKIGIFGCGNMGSAIAAGLSKSTSDSLPELYFYTPSKTKAMELARIHNGNYVELEDQMPKDLDWYILAFKPQTLNDFNFRFNEDVKILSVLAGIDINKLEKKFNVKKIARLMPNTPSRLGLGANLFFSDFDASDLTQKLTNLGKLFVTESEMQLDKLTAFSGSGPALIFEFARLFEKHLKVIAGDCKFSRELIVETFAGSSELMRAALLEDKSFETLREEVTSKRGVTFEALSILENNNFDHIVGRAFDAAYKRTIEIKKGI